MIHAFGCSCTRYFWPTYADLINQVEKCVNWGRAGVGNKTIFTRVVTALTNGLIQPGDRVIVQWSGYTRYDLWLRPGRWLQRGNVWHQTPGQGPITDQFLRELWNDQDALIQSVTLAVALKDLLRSKGIDYVYIYMNDFKKQRLEANSGEYQGLLTKQIELLEECSQIRGSMIDWLSDLRLTYGCLQWREKGQQKEQDLHPEPRESAVYLQKLQHVLNWTDSEWQQMQTCADHSQQLLEQANSRDCQHPRIRENQGPDNVNYYPGFPLFPRDHIKYFWDNEPI